MKKIKYTILSSSVTSDEDTGAVSFSFRCKDSPNIIWGVEDMVFDIPESNIIAGILIFREQRENGQIVANQVHTEDAEYKDLLRIGEKVVNDVLVTVLKDIMKSE